MEMNISVYKKTEDNWYPPFRMEGGESLVEVSIIRHNDNLTRIVVSGNDDYLLEKEFVRYTRGWTVFCEIIGSKFVSQPQLIDLGFVQ